MNRVLIFTTWILIVVALIVARRTEGAAYRAPWPWIAIADCETGGDSTPGRAPYHAHWHIDAYHDGGLQFHPDTWRRAKAWSDVRGFAYRYAYAWQAPPWVQVAVARSWLRRTSWSQWPVCSRKAGVA